MLDRVLPLVILVGAFAYAVGIRRLWANARTVRLVSSAQAAAFGAAVVTLLVALESPLESAAARDLPWHMVQHLLLLAVAAPLLAVGEPVTVMTQALPDHMRRKVRPVVRRINRSQTSTRGWLAWTVVAFFLSTAALALWHVPAFYDAAVAHTEVHALEHVTFVATATLFWWMALGASRRSRRGLGVLAVFAATLPATALGDPPHPRPDALVRAVRTRCHRVARPAGRGRVMWGFGGSALVVGAAALFASWLTNMDRIDEARRPQSAVEPW